MGRKLGPVPRKSDFFSLEMAFWWILCGICISIPYTPNYGDSPHVPVLYAHVCGIFWATFENLSAKRQQRSSLSEWVSYCGSYTSVVCRCQSMDSVHRLTSTSVLNNTTYIICIVDIRQAEHQHVPWRCRWFINQSMARQNKNGANTQPCLTPDGVGNGRDK